MKLTHSHRLAAVTAFALLAACNGDRSSADYYSQTDTISVTASRVASAPPQMVEKEAGNVPDVPVAGSLLAYSYSMGISAPALAVPMLVGNHEQACRDAGPSKCQILGSSTNQYGDNQVNAQLEIRAEPEWLATFRGMIASDAHKSGGKVVNENVYSEDLTSYIVDTQARLEAKIALRDRIKKLLATSEGSLSDVLAAERELSNVQGEIESMTAQLKSARARVSMSALSISYSSDPETSVGVFKPLRDAFGDFGRTSVASLASAVEFVARSWPFFILLLIAAGIGRAWLRGRRKA